MIQDWTMFAHRTVEMLPSQGGLTFPPLTHSAQLSVYNSFAVVVLPPLIVTIWLWSVQLFVWTHWNTRAIATGLWCHSYGWNRGGVQHWRPSIGQVWSNLEQSSASVRLLVYSYWIFFNWLNAKSRVTYFSLYYDVVISNETRFFKALQIPSLKVAHV